MLRDSILRNLARNGAQFSGYIERQFEYEKPEIKVIGPARRFLRGWTIGACVALISGGAVLGILVDRSHQTITPVTVTARQAASGAQSVGLRADQEETQRRKQEMLEQEVASLKIERTRLGQDLQRAQGQSKDLQTITGTMREQIDTVNNQLEDARVSQARAEEVLERIKAERQSDQTAIAAQNREIVALNAKLEEKSAEKDQGQDILDAERKLRELVGARNLHIVDVYDTDADGRTRKAAGRVFYTEGKSLVFYAYDLSTDRSAGQKYAYYVWGHREGDERNARNLGTLDPDDLAQKRWMLKVNDAQALAKIDRVFVTLEPLNKPGLLPRGKKILSAYLGTPANHP